MVEVHGWRWREDGSEPYVRCIMISVAGEAEVTGFLESKSLMYSSDKAAALVADADADAYIIRYRSCRCLAILWLR